MSGVGLNALLAVALGLSSLLKDEGQLVLHAVELDSEGHGLPVGGTLALKLDYTVDVRVKPVTVGVLAIKMSDEQPMRVRNRNVRLTIHPERTGLDIFELDFSRADMEIEDPGGWLINSPGSLFDILGTRSGRGSMWLEVDLRFKLNLGPVKVSGATIRAVRDDSGFSASLRGLDASLDVPGVIEGRGSLQLTPAGGVAAVLDASLVPLNLAAGATVAYEPHGDSFELYLRVGVDLPGPIPIANTGLGLYGVAGAFGVNAKPVIHDPDPIKGQLKWNSSDPASFGFAKGDLTIGVEAVIGTVPDLGFSFSARGGVFLTVPDIAIRGALLGRVLSPRLRVFDRPSDAALGVSFKGIVVVDGADGVTVALEGKLEAPPLLEVVVPLGAHFPFSRPGVEASDWFIHLGADGFVNPKPDGRAIGPIRAKVLPELVPVSADAYLMQRGKGIEKWPRGEPGSITIKDGLLLAFGFGFDYTLGVRPLAWADVHASADILLATRPLLLAGFGDVGGSLNLGPFSMGVEADLRFLVCENADPYLHARLCGRIDLFFTDIEGCVEISIHNEPAKSVPFPDVHPLDRVEHGDVTGDLAFLIDDRYRRVAPLARDPAHAPTVWPDTLLHLGFGVSPSLAPGYAGGQFAGIDSYPSGLAAKPIGSDMLEYDWTLRRVALFDVTGNPTGAGTHVPGPLSAAWQLGKDGDLGVRPQAGDLVLLTYQGDLWLNRLADGGASIPGDPLSQAGKYCQGDAAAGLGWALGWGATGAAAQLLLPPAELWPDPTVSRFTATVRLGCSGLKGDPILGPRTVLQLPPPFDYRAPSTAPLAPPVDLERAFEGFLDLGGVGGEREFANTALVQPSEPLDDARLWLVVRNADDQQPTVIDDLGRHWRGESRHLDSGRTALRFAPPAPGTIRHVLVLWTSDTWLAVLGLGGVTRSALAAAKARRDARAAEAARQQQAAAAQPQKAAQTTGGGVRCILQPGRLYRLDVAMSWSGTLSEQKEDGSTTVVASLTDQTKYRPKGAPPGGVDTARSFFFQTTKAPAPGAAVLPVKYGDSLYLALVHERQDLFDPALLVRHLGGYTPAQSEVDRFRDDPLQAHFRAGHVATLARAFGFDLDLGLRRIDVAGSEGNEQMLGAALLALAKPAILSKGDQRRFALSETAPCPTPKPGSTLEADRQLSERAWYEVYVVARARTSGVADGRLPGVTFRTSRWRAPADMLAALRFGAAHPGAPDGDVEVRESPPAPAGVIDGSDADFGVALRALGLEGWPLAEEPRASLLWVPAAGSSPPWRLAGVLLESPEAIDRPGRCEVRQLVAQPGGAAFDVRRSDRNRSRLLFLTTSPFAPGAAGTGATVVSLELLDRRTAAPLVGSLALPAQPSFAGEP